MARNSVKHIWSETPLMGKVREWRMGTARAHKSNKHVWSDGIRTNAGPPAGDSMTGASGDRTRHEVGACGARVTRNYGYIQTGPPLAGRM